MLESYGPYIKNAKTFVNAAATAEEADSLIVAGKIDSAFIGFNWITHPDLAKWVLHGKVLDNIPGIPHLQGGKGDKDWTVGYTDYPVAASVLDGLFYL